MISVSGRVMGWIVVIALVVPAAVAWRLLWPPLPADRGQAAIEQAFPDSAVECLIGSIAAEPGRFRVDAGSYLEPFDDRTFLLRDRNHRHTVSFSTERHLAFFGFYGQTALVPYGPC